MLECQNCDGIDIDCTDAYEREDGSLIEELECAECGAAGQTITPPWPGDGRVTGAIRAV